MANTCSICLGKYKAGEVLRRLPCLHSFHQPCIDAWMASDSTCPICRLSLLPPHYLPNVDL
jgi:E3 ubiquitin-protein ligase ATL7/58/59